MIPNEAKLVSREEMQAQSTKAREQGNSVVFTNGCFDIIHVGHVRYLYAARRLGSALYVGINSDASARRLKGEGRPINTECDRAGVVAALEMVDLVTIFDEDTAGELVAQVHPAVYVKGGDYDADPVSTRYPPEAAIVSRYGGTVRVIPYESGYSTTGTLDRIRTAG